MNVSFVSFRRLYLTRLPHVIAAGSAWSWILGHANDFKEFVQKIDVSHNHCDTNHIRLGSIHLLCSELFVQH